ncbi:polyamine ABC transporter substrate-binding protein [Pseudomonas jessenii]|uniref:Polyamine ABC transporter substrate-binding protein n=1 Tax=Pseudomonas jessenii TaxID=77298 RepID=A0A2W0EG34_PSEJE|nr:polyamine ABC transporter substrate-binding protein [Pseudomonas jessenii]PYY67733.1 polyamine ABC transporter substrate-binding protein [Pseudomonas jessenii]
MCRYRSSLNLGISTCLSAWITTATADAPTVHVYNWYDYIGPTTLQDFKRDTGIEPVYDTFDSGEVLEAKLMTGHSGYDVVVASNFILPALIKAGALQKLDRSQLPNLKHIDPVLLEKLRANDPDNQYAIPYLWGTDGIGYNVEKVRAALGEQAPVNSWDLLFKEENLAKLSQCGVGILDAPAEILPIALHYLGLPPNSSNPDDYKKAEALMLKLRPYITYFNSSKIGSDLANGDICVALTWSGTVFGARQAANEAGKGVKIEYSIPVEGAPLWSDNLVLVKDGSHPEHGLTFINYMLRPEVIAPATDLALTANANKDANALVSAEVQDTPNIYPSAQVIATLFTLQPQSHALDRVRTRSWSNIKNGN